MVSTPVHVENPVSDSERSEARKCLGISEDCVVVGNAGWLIQRKRWDVFLDVAQAVLKKEANVRFVIAGDGELRGSLEKKARDAGIFEKIIWMGWQTNLEKFYRTIDILLFNSDWDAQARTPLEAMSRGIPVVASILAGGTQEVIKNGSCSILMDQHDVAKLSESIIMLAGNSDARKSMGQKAVERIAEYGSPSQHAVKVLAAMGFNSNCCN
jgi:glycosyltransferase involved in cell wall biosynthesis